MDHSILCSTDLSEFQDLIIAKFSQLGYFVVLLHDSHPGQGQGFNLD